MMTENKERLVGQPEKTEVVDLEKRREVTVKPEVEHWMRKVENLTAVKQQISGDKQSGGGGVTLTKVKIGVTRKSFVEGFKKTVSDAGRWLSAFIFRLIKKKGGEVEFKEE